MFFYHEKMFFHLEKMFFYPDKMFFQSNKMFFPQLKCFSRFNGIQLNFGFATHVLGKSDHHNYKANSQKWVCLRKCFLMRKMFFHRIKMFFRQRKMFFHQRKMFFHQEKNVFSSEKMFFHLDAKMFFQKNIFLRSPKKGDPPYPQRIRLVNPLRTTAWSEHSALRQ